MFSKYKKSGGSGQVAQPELKAVDGGAASAPGAENKPQVQRKATPAPAQAAPQDKEKKRKERLGEIKLELHKTLLDNLNLSARWKARPNRTCARRSWRSPANVWKKWALS